MFARVFSGGINGVDADCIEVECDCHGGIGQIQIVGLPDTSVKESQERVRTAIKACDFYMPFGKKWVVNLAPADTRKEGPAYDLPIAIGILAATGMVPTSHISKFWLLGELGLDGSVRPVTGALPMAIAAQKHGAYGIILPEGNAEEASLVEGLRVFPVTHLKQVCSILHNPNKGAYLQVDPRREFMRRVKMHTYSELDFIDVKGNISAKKAMMISAAGRHNLLMVGSPGSGKSMLAQRLPTIMPPLGFEESLELTKLYSVAGLLAKHGSLVLNRPFRSPHHSASAVGLVGGGGYPRPGEISLSHLGVLFLDELTEFPRAHLENLRQPLETANVTISRANQTLTYPASFVLVAACNPCPCGFHGDKLELCKCTEYQRSRYWSKLSGPLLDRIDLQVSVPRLEKDVLEKRMGSMSSEFMRLSVLRAYERQRHRFRDQPFMCNANMDHRAVVKFCRVDYSIRAELAEKIAAAGGTARAYDRVLKVARTLADLDDRERVTASDIMEAVNLRTIKRSNLPNSA